jgi:hypothetical protein
MNLEVKTKWVEALRSGEYKQTQKRLRDKVGYCCLGVLCDLHSKETGQEWENECIYLGHAEILPDEVVAWAGFNKVNLYSSFGITPNGQGVQCDGMPLSQLNDEGQTFEQIAKVIEEKL